MLLLFALVLGLSAVVAALVPPPEQADDEPAPGPGTDTAAPAPAPAPPNGLAVTVPPEGARDDAPVIRRTRTGSRVALTVRVPEAGDVAIDGLGLRQSADPLAPARFHLLADPVGRYAVWFEPVDGPDRIVARLVVEPVARVRPPRPGR